MQYVKTYDGSWTARITALALVAAFAGCAATTDDGRLDESDVTSHALPLGTGFTTNDTRFSTPWASPGVVNICFIAPAGTALDQSLATRAENAIVASWQAACGLTFTMKGECPATIPSSWISIFIRPQYMTQGGITAMGGKGVRFTPTYDPTVWAKLASSIDNRLDVQIYMSGASNWELVTAHEMGHALGFYHEQERDDNTTSCQSSSNDNPFGHLTDYDTDSIMLWSYCPNHRDSTDLLSPLDKLGAEIVYPRSFSHSVGAHHGLAAGNRVLLRADDAVLVDWSLRGAATSTYPDLITWWTSAAPATQSVAYPGVLLPQGVLTAIEAQFTDFLDRDHTAYGTVEANTGLHTAIVGVVSGGT